MYLLALPGGEFSVCAQDCPDSTSQHPAGHWEMLGTWPGILATS